MANPNLLQATSCTLGWSQGAIGTGTTTVVSTAAADSVRKVVSLYACNTSASSVTLEVWVDNPGIEKRIVHDLTIPANATVVIVTKEAPIHLTEQYYAIQASASASGIDMNACYEDYS